MQYCFMDQIKNSFVTHIIINSTVSGEVIYYQGLD